LPREALQTATVVEKIAPEGPHGWQLVARPPRCNSRTQVFDAVIIAAPPFVAARLLHDVSTPLAAELAAINYQSCSVVNLAFRREQIGHPLEAFGFVSPLIELRQVTACTFSSVKYPGRAPAGACLLRAYLGGAANPEAIQWSEERLAQAALEDLVPLLQIQGPPALATVRRHRAAMPQYEIGHLDRVARIEQLAAELPGLALAGSAYRGGGVAHCIHSGEQAAERLARELPRIPAADLARS